jgi:hypothetical protein
MSDEEWKEKGLKELTRLVEKFGKFWKPAKKELEVINLVSNKKRKN